MSEASDGGVETVELEFPARPEVVSVARLVVGAVAATDPSFDEERTADLRLAVSEACTNAVQAQRRREATLDTALEPITLRATLTDGVIAIEVIDHGGGFEPTELGTHPEVTDPARLEYEGGLGVPLIRMLTDDLEFFRLASGTRVVMRFEARPSDSTSSLGEQGRGSDPSQ